MQRTKIYLTIIGMLILLSTPLRAMAKTIDSNNKTLIPVSIFSKEQNINDICVHSKISIKKPDLQINNNQGWCIKPEDEFLLMYQKKNGLNHHLPESITLLEQSPEGICLKTRTISTRCYHGNINVKSKDKTLLLTNYVPLIDYLNSTVGSELPPGWPAEAVKAQTIAIHNYLLYLLKTQKTITDITQNQFYGGIKYENPQYNNFIKDVKNVVMIDKKGNLIEALYHSTCSGGTLGNETVFGGQPVNYLRPRPCTFDKDSNFFNSKNFEISEKKLKKLIKSTQLDILYDKNNSVQSVILDNKTLTSYQFWLILGKALGWGAVPGVKYNIECHNHYCIINSKGAGHAVGLCQWGAKGMAKLGYNYRDILSYYYTNIYFSNKN